MALGTDYIIRYLSDISGAVKGAKDVEAINARVAQNIQERYGKVASVIGQIAPKSVISPITSGQFAGLNKEIVTTGEIVKTTSGSFLELSKTQTIIGGELRNTSSSIRDVTSQFVKTNLEAEKGNKVFTNLGDNIKQLAGRALLTIPIWLALRSAVMGTLSAMQEGFQALVTESLALQKAKQNLQGSVTDIAANFAKLKEESKALALETGISQDKIISAFQKFATVGFDYTTSMSGANSATKLAIILQGDAVEVANAFARSMRVLIDRSKGAKSESEQLADAMSLTLELWRTNAFEIGEMTQSLEKFSGTAKTMNFTTAQTIALLATLGTAGLRGSQAGTLLKTSIGKLVENLDKLSASVGIKFNKNLDSAFDVLVRVIDQIKILSETSKLAPEATEAIAEIFGGVRGAQPVRALIALREELQKALDTTPDLKKFNDSFIETEKVLGNVVARFHVANQEIGKGFITGITGGEDFVHSLDKIVETLNNIQSNAKDFGDALRLPFSEGFKASMQYINAITEAGRLAADFVAPKSFKESLIEALQGGTSLENLTNVFNELLKVQTFKINVGLDESFLNAALQNLKEAIRTFGLEPQKDITAEIERQINLIEDMVSAEQKSIPVVATKKDIIQLEGAARKELSALGLTELEIEEKILFFRETSGKFMEADLILQKELINNMARVEEIELRRSRDRGLIDNQLEILKLQGATSLQLVQQRIELERLYGVNQSRADLLRNELELNKEITKEKINQNKVSNDSVKIFEIAQRFGNTTATRISEFLTGNRPVTAFETGGAQSDLMPILKEFFSAQLAQAQATRFFFEGRGTNIPIPERRAIEDFIPLPVEAIKLPEIKTQIDNVKIEIKKLFSKEDTAQQIIDSIKEAFQNTEIINAMHDVIDNY